MSYAPLPTTQRVPRPLTPEEQAVVDAKRAKIDAAVTAKFERAFGRPEKFERERTKQARPHTSAWG